MDTLGTISPQPAAFNETPHRTEVFERLRYIAHTGKCGVLTGAGGVGKSLTFVKLAAQLRREGLSVACISLSGVTADEFPHRLAACLGLGVPVGVGGLAIWTLLREHAEGRRAIGSPTVFLIDHMDRADASALLALERAMEAFQQHSSWLFASRTQAPASLKSFLRERAWMRIELRDVEPEDASRILALELASRDRRVRMTPEAIDAALELSQGRIDKLRQLAELAHLAATADDCDTVNRDQLAALAEELLV